MNNNNTTYNNPPLVSSGFTLVEMMIVVAILAIISAIAIPVYRNYITASKINAARASIEQFSVLLESYRAENGTFPPDNTYTYKNNGSTDTISPLLPDFKSKSSTAPTASFNYSLKITNSGKSNETATYTAIGIGDYNGINATGTYQ